MAAIELVRFGVFTFCTYAALGLFSPYAPVWFQSLGLSPLVIGLIASLQSWTRLVVPFGWSWLADHSGRRIELIRLAALGALLAAMGLLGVRSATAVALMATLLFAAHSAIAPLVEASLVQRLTAGRGIDAGRYGRVRLWGSMGFIAAVFTFGTVLDRGGVDLFPRLVLAVNGVLLAAALALPVGPAPGLADSTPRAGPGLLARLRQPVLITFFASIFFTVLAHVGLYAFYSLYLVSQGYGQTAIGGLWALGVLAEVLFFWGQGRWFARLSAPGWLVLAGWVTAVRFGAIAAGGRWIIVLVLAQLLHAITFAAHHSACMAVVQQHFPGRLRGRGQALYMALGYGLSGILGGLCGGWLIDQAGYAAMFWAASASGALAAICAGSMGRAALPAAG